MKIVFIWIGLIALLQAKEPIRLGVFAYAGVETTYEEYAPLVAYLNETLEYEVVLEVLTQSQIDARMASGTLDMITTNPIHFLDIRQRVKLSGALATLLIKSPTHVIVGHVSGLIFVRAQSPITTLAALEGKTVLAPSTRHLGGFRAQLMELYRAGVDVNSLKVTQTHGAHQEVFARVRAGEAEVGFVREGIWERMIASGEIQPQDFRIIGEQKHEDYPYVVSTKLYPEWPLFAMPHVKPHKAKEFLGALFSLKADSPHLAHTKIAGYTLPADYLEVEELSRTLKLPPFDKERPIGWSDVWEAYRVGIVLGILFLGLLSYFFIRQRRKRLLLESMLSHMADGVYAVNHEGMCTFINAQALSMLGFTHEEVIGVDQHALFHHTKPDGTPYAQSACPVFQTVQDRTTRALQEQFIKKDGSLLPVALTVAPLDVQGGAIVVFRDLSIFKTQQAALEQSQTLFKTLFEIFPEPIVIYDVATKLPVEFNHAAYEQMELDPQTYAKKPIGAFDAIESPQETQAHIQKILDKGSDSFDTQQRTTSGKILDVHVTVKLITMQGKRYFLTVMRNITSAVTYQRNLTVQNARMQSIIEGTNVGTWEWDILSGRTYFNERWAEIVGYTLEELQPISIETWMHLAHPNDLEQCNKKIQDHFEGKTDYYECESRMRHKEGHWVWVLDRGRVNVRDPKGKPLKMSGTHQDITDRKLIEEALKAERDLFSQGPVLTIEWDPSSHWPIRYVSANVTDILGYTAEEMQSEDFLYAALIHPDDAQRIFKEVTYYIENFINAYEQSYRLRLKNGTYRWFYDFTQLVRNEEGVLISIRGYMFDQTQLKQAQEEMQKAVQEAQEASSAKGQFLANMSHEIRTPLNAVIGLSSVLYDMGLGEKQRDYVQKIMLSSKMLLGIINDILDYSKIEAGKLVLETKPLKIEDVIEQLRVLFTQTSKPGVELGFDVKNSVPYAIVGDELRLNQVLVNFLSNAVKFTSNGNVKLTVRLLERLGEHRAQLKFCVQDTGIGMSEEQISHLFEPFVQADSSTTRKYGGTGLGLVISKKIIEAMKGHLIVESQENVGSTFSFIIDVAVQSWVKGSPQALNARVLVVDDAAFSREILTEVLLGFGCHVVQASSGQEALEAITRADKAGTPFDFVLLDWAMPEMDGFAVVKTLESLHAQKLLHNKAPRIFIVSSKPQKELPLEDLDISGFLTKPVTAQTLQDVLFGAPAQTYMPQTPIRKLEGMRVLLVEDNALNVEVALLMLERIGVKADVAYNGQEGVAMEKAHPKRYDAILMDVQMPIMGGYEAARLIRQTNTTIPIVALTAAAMIEDKTKAQEAGMSDHLSKPIDEQALYEILASYYGMEVPSIASIIEISQEVLDIAYITKLVGGKQESVKKLLTSFLTQLQEEFAALPTMLQTPNQESSALLHALKGVSGNMGAKMLFALCVQIEAQLKETGSVQTVQIMDFKTAIEQLIKAIEESL